MTLMLGGPRSIALMCLGGFIEHHPDKVGKRRDGAEGRGGDKKQPPVASGQA